MLKQIAKLLRKALLQLHVVKNHSLELFLCITLFPHPDISVTQERMHQF